jgi:hypothetical protein
MKISRPTQMLAMIQVCRPESEPTPHLRSDSATREGNIVLLQSIKVCTAAGFFVFAGAFGVQTAASAQAPFDGVWSISIVTTKGTCEGGSGLSVKINEGKVASGDNQLAVSGRVAEHGGITVTVIQGETKATGSGKLVNAAGFGTWRGGPCSGTWSAQKI